MSGALLDSCMWLKGNWNFSFVLGLNKKFFKHGGNSLTEGFV